MPNAIRAYIDFSLNGQIGHNWAPTFAIPSPSRSVFINNMPAIVVGDQYEQSIHISKKGTHPTSAGVGSSDVFIEGLPVHRAFDPMTCGDLAGGGSSDVFINGLI